MLITLIIGLRSGILYLQPYITIIKTILEQEQFNFCQCQILYFRHHVLNRVKEERAFFSVLTTVIHTGYFQFPQLTRTFGSQASNQVSLSFCRSSLSQPNQEITFVF